MAEPDVSHIQRNEGRQRRGHCVSRFRRDTLARPLVVAVVLGGFVVVAAGVLVVAFAYRVGHVLVAVLGVDIAHETLPFAAVRTGELLGLVARQSFAL